jgi:hypothetical protein
MYGDRNPNHGFNFLEFAQQIQHMPLKAMNITVGTQNY